MRAHLVGALTLGLALLGCGADEEGDGVRLAFANQAQAEQAALIHLTVHGGQSGCTALRTAAGDAQSFEKCSALDDGGGGTCYLVRVALAPDARNDQGDLGVLMRGVPSGGVNILAVAFDTDDAVIASGCASTHVDSGRVHNVRIELD